MHLGFGGASPYGSPADEIREIEEAGGIEEFGGGGQPQAVDVEQHLAGQVQALVDVVAAIQMRIEHQPLPADRGARLLKIGTHHYLQAVLIGDGEPSQSPGIVEGGDGIMDGAGAYHHQEAIVLP